MELATRPGLRRASNPFAFAGDCSKLEAVLVGGASGAACTHSAPKLKATTSASVDSTAIRPVRTPPVLTTLLISWNRENELESTERVVDEFMREVPFKITIRVFELATRVESIFSQTSVNLQLTIC